MEHKAAPHPLHSPLPNIQSPIPNPQSPIPNLPPYLGWGALVVSQKNFCIAPPTPDSRLPNPQSPTPHNGRLTAEPWQRYNGTGRSVLR